jgi:aminopeptidase N
LTDNLSSTSKREDFFLLFCPVRNSISSTENSYQFLDEWQKGEIQNNIRIEFTGIIDYVEAGSFNEGFFIDYYIGPNGEFNNILVTQFESCGGRKAFPMFDEPEYKATFNLEVTLNGNEGYYALWNTDANEVIERSTSSVT